MLLIEEWTEIWQQQPKFKHKKVEKVAKHLLFDLLHKHCSIENP